MDGAANEALVSFLAERLGVPALAVASCGHGSRDKVVAVTASAPRRWLDAWALTLSPRQPAVRLRGAGQSNPWRFALLAATLNKPLKRMSPRRFGLGDFRWRLPWSTIVPTLDHRIRHPRERLALLEPLLARRILVLDGAMGTMIQGYGLGSGITGASGSATGPATSRATATSSASPSPQVIREIHGAYLEAGADIIETNSFTSNAIPRRRTTGWKRWSTS